MSLHPITAAFNEMSRSLDKWAGKDGDRKAWAKLARIFMPMPFNAQINHALHSMRQNRGDEQK